MSSKTVIIFGASGHVGSAAALGAREAGSRVYLAMRNPEKPIPSIDDSFERIQADLTKPETVREAVKSTGAKNAFIYLIFQAPDGMKASIEALKSAGVEHVVFLSSASVMGDVKLIQNDNPIAFIHAQVESNLEDIFGNNFVAVRPTYFATNTLGWKNMIQEGVIGMVYPEAKFDYISPGDIGRVCGKLITGSSERFVRLSGPELISQETAIKSIGNAIGKDLKLLTLNEEEALEYWKSKGLSQDFAKRLIEIKRMANEGILYNETYEEDAKNVEKYLGKSTSFSEWATENKVQFL